MPANAACQATTLALIDRFREQARSHIGVVSFWKLGRSDQMGRSGSGGLLRSRRVNATIQTVGAGLPAKAACQATTLALITAFASKPAPTLEWCRFGNWEGAIKWGRSGSGGLLRSRRVNGVVSNWEGAISNCGSGLAREDGVSGNHAGTEPPLSRANPLPHLLCGVCETE